MPTRDYTPRRYVSSVPRHSAPPDAFTGDSTNWQTQIDGEDEGRPRFKATRRLGQNTPSGWDTVLNAAWTGNVPRGRQIIGMRATQLTDKSQHPTVLFTDDEGDKRGEVVTYDSTQVDWYSMGQEYGTTHYPVTTGYYGGTAAAGSGLTLNYRWCPLWCNQTSAPRYHRGTTAANRQKMLAGGRAMMEVGEWLFGTSDGTPWMWHKAWNYATGSGSNVNRLRPWMHQPPLYHPVITVQGGTASVKPWRKERVFFYSVAFVFEDGSIGPFTDIQDAVANLMSNGTRGRVILDATNDYYEYMRWTKIPRGPKGTIGRVLARTSQSDTTAYQATYPGANDLRIVTILRNNTQETYDDYQGDDETLIATPDLVRIDHKAPPRGKYLVANDKRFLMCGSLKPHPAAIILAPTGVDATRDINAYGNASGNYIADPDNQRSDEYDTSPAPGTQGFLVELSTTACRLHYDNGSSVNVSSQTHTSSGVSITLQGLVNLINQTTVASGSKEWAAQLAPGVDGSTSCSTLEVTTNSCNVGDDGRTNGLASVDDLIWVRGPADPIVLYFSKTNLDSFPTQEQAVEWTRGGPSDTPSAILNWSASNETERSPGDASVGRCLGAAPLGEMFIVFYERGIYRLASCREGNADEDLRLFPITVGNVLVASDSSIFWGDGYAGCMTSQGIWVTDGVKHMILPASRDVWNSEKRDPADNTRGLGEWKNEITRSLKATQAGGRTTADDESFLYAQVLSDQLHVGYRKSTTAANDRSIVLDASANADRSGLSVFKAKDGTDLGFGCPRTTTYGVMAEIADQSGGMVRYGVVDNVAQGRVDKFDSGIVDGAATLITATGYFTTDFMDTLKLKQAEQAAVLYAKNGSGLSLVLARDQGTSPSVHGTDTYTHALATTGDDLYGRKIVDLAPEARTPTDVLELRIVDDGSGDPPEVFRVALSYDVLDFPR